MTQWTPKLEELIRQFGDAEEKQLQSVAKSKTTAGALVSFAFNGHAMISAYEKACAEAGLETSQTATVWEKNIQTLIDLAQQNGSPAADKIKKVKDFGDTTYKAFLAKHPDVKNPDSLRGAYTLIKAAKKENLRF